MPSPPAPCKPIIHLEKREALPSHSHLHQGFVHQEKSVIHFEEKLHTLMVTRTIGAGQAAECKIVRLSMVRKTINTINFLLREPQRYVNINNPYLEVKYLKF